MRALILICGAALAVASCEDDLPEGDLTRIQNESVPTDPCAADPDGRACHDAVAYDACLEAEDQPGCVAAYRRNNPYRGDRAKTQSR